MERRIEQADRDGQSVHRLEDLLEVDLLHPAEFGERRLFFGLGLGEDHLAHDRQAVGGQEHVLGAAQPDALGAEIAGVGGVLTGVGVGADGQLALAHLIGPREQHVELGRRLGVLEHHRPEHDLAGGAVERDDVALPHHDVTDG